MQTNMIGLLPLFADLFLFGEGGDGGAGAAPGGEAPAGQDAGVTVPDAAGQQRRPHKATQSTRLDVEYGKPVDEAEAPAKETAPKAEEAQETWESVSKRYEKEINELKANTIKERFKNQKSNDDRMAQMEAMLEPLARRYGIEKGEDGKIDLEAFGKAVEEDDELYEDEAAKRGMSVETYRHVEKLEREAAERKAADEAKARDAEMYAEYQQVVAQAAEAKKLYPNLDLNTEMANPDFARLIRAHVPVGTAYKVVHDAEITAALMQHTAQLQATAISNSIQAGRARPVENGLGRSSPSNAKRITDPRLLTKEQRRDIRDRVGRGEKIAW